MAEAVDEDGRVAGLGGGVEDTDEVARVVAVHGHGVELDAAVSGVQAGGALLGVDDGEPLALGQAAGDGQAGPGLAGARHALDGQAGLAAGLAGGPERELTRDVLLLGEARGADGRRKLGHEVSSAYLRSTHLGSER